ncbi:MAG TPA: B-box zinc finger protein [Pyrinomonadaceae bacterium]|jgi:hypothetical protein|nr:B-box zinc finger protein [Pyrinomonadaceae bacterium]
MSAQANQWRVSTVEGIFETDLETLKQWIVEGCVLPTDKVSKGQLSWIDAGKAPMLRAAFNGEYVPATEQPPPPVAVPESVPVVADSPAENKYSPEPEFENPAADEHSNAHQDFSAGQLGNACHNHPEAYPKFICRVCATPFCEECPRYVGTTKIAVCPLCGDMCKPFEEVHNRIQRMNFQDAGFGISDFGRALAYPLNHKIALVFGAAVYGFLQLAGVRGRVIAFVIMFGCISHVISQVAWGRLNRSFLPDFSAFSLWDDLAVPIGLGIGITVVTWGPALTLILAIFFGVIAPKVKAAADLESAKPKAAGLTSEDLGALTNPEADPKKLEEANAKLTGGRPDVIIAKEAKASQEKLNDPAGDIKALAKYAALPVILVILFLGTVAWGIFYGPMALCVAGYTEHFGSVINPLVGLDTIKRMGGTYFKAFGMVLLLQIVGMIISIIVAIITAPFALPFVGNLPANFIDGAITFYFNLVIACVLGLSLHKCADRLGIDLK